MIEKKQAEGDTHRAIAFAHGLSIFAFSSELAFLNVQAKKCGHPETPGFWYTCSVATIS